jgi:predicted type IV restriction endonuclease
MTTSVDIKKALKKYLPHLLKAKAENLNEADTVQRLVKVLEEVFGYDAMEDITRETAIKDRFCDVGLKIDGAIRMLVEVKSAGTELRDRHTEQAQNYAAHANIPWVLLTNGVAWKLYHLTFGEGIESVLAVNVDLSDGNVTDERERVLALIHRHSVKRGDLDAYWIHRIALGPASIGKALFTEEVLRFIRREIRRREGILIDEEDLGRALHNMFTVEAREQIGPLKVRRRRKIAKKDVTIDAVAAPQPDLIDPDDDDDDEEAAS